VSGPASDLADGLAGAGAVVGGGAALFATVTFVVASLLHDAGHDEVAPLEWASRGAQFGGVLGLAALGWRAVGIK
jgi:hypothetical protein